MAVVSNGQSSVIRTERGLSIAGTRITLYDVMEYLAAGWPSELIRDRLDLTERQITEALAYINAHRPEVEAEYQTVIHDARESRQYWEEHNRERFAQIAARASKPGQEALRKKLAEWKARIASDNDHSC